MRVAKRCLALVALALLPVEDGAAGPAALKWVDCWFDHVRVQELRCAQFRPSRTKAEPETQLPVVVIQAPEHLRRSSRILHLPGGPGSPAGLDDAGIQRWLNWLEIARWPHDLVLFDPRGTGLSRPRRDCAEIRDRDRANLTQPLSAAADLREMQDAAAACFRRLGDDGFRPEHYSTPRQVRDVIELMQALGGKDWNLYGVSYGSRLALQVLRQFPEAVRGLVLDSAYPPEVNGLLSRPAQFGRAWNGLLAGCEAEAACRTAYPRLEKQLESLRRQLLRKPVLLRVEHWPTDRVTPLMLNDYRLMWILFAESYRPRYRPRLIPAIAAATTEDFALWPPIAGDFLEQWLDPEHSHAVYLSVSCAEDFAGLTEARYAAEVLRYPQVADHVAAEWRLSPCHRWPVPPVPDRFREPVVSGVPVLFLGGAHDTATLPEWSRQAVARFKHGYRVIFEGSSHAVSWENPCAMATVWEFLQDPQDWRLPPCLTPGERRGVNLPAGER